MRLYALGAGRGPPAGIQAGKAPAALWPAEARPAGALGRKERLENVAELVGRNADAVIGDDDADPLSVRFGRRDDVYHRVRPAFEHAGRHAGASRAIVARLFPQSRR